MYKVILNRKGYTLIELLCTITILLIIAIPVSSVFLTAHMNNNKSELLEKSMLLGQKILENRMSDGDLATELSADVSENPPVSQGAPYEGLKVQTIITAVDQSILVEKDALGNDKAEPNTPVEVIVGNTGKRSIYKLPLDSGLSLAQVDEAVKPIGSVVEDYYFKPENLVLRSAEALKGMDGIFYLEEHSIRQSTELSGVYGQDITLSFEPVEALATQYKLTIKYGSAPFEIEITETLNLTGLTEANKKMRIAFVIDNENTVRRIKLSNKPTFLTELYVVRGVKEQAADTYYSGTGTGLNLGKPLLSLTYGTEDGSGGYLDNDPKLASDMIQVYDNIKNKNEAVTRVGRLYEIRVRIFNEADDASTAKPIVELKTYRRAVL